MWAFSADELQWDAVAWDSESSSPGPRSSHACAKLDDDSFVLFGGMTLTKRGEHTEEDRESSHGSAWHEGDDDRQELMADLWKFTRTDRLSGRWTRLPNHSSDRPRASSDASLVATSGKTLVLLGGCSGRDARSEAWRYEVEDGKWTRMPFGDEDAYVPRAAELAADDGEGEGEDGGGGGNVTAPNSTLAAPLRTLELPTARCAHTAAAVHRRGGGEADVLLFGGRRSVRVLREEGSYSGSEQMWQSIAGAWRLRTRQLGSVLERWMRAPDEEEEGGREAEEDSDSADSDGGSGEQQRGEGWEEEEGEEDEDEDDLPSLWDRLDATSALEDGEMIAPAESEGRESPSPSGSEALLLNRSDHAAVLHGGSLYVFGGCLSHCCTRCPPYLRAGVRPRASGDSGGE
jgi:hypothetical protein